MNMDDERTVWCGNLSEKVTEELLFELFLQTAPLVRVRIPKDKDGRQSNFAFVTFKHKMSVDYAVQLLDGIRLYDKNIIVKPRNGGSQNKYSERNLMERNYSDRDLYNSIQNRLFVGAMKTRQMAQPMAPKDIRYKYRQNDYHDHEDNRYRDNHATNKKRDYHEHRQNDSPDRRRYNFNRGNFKDRNNRRNKFY